MRKGMGVLAGAVAVAAAVALARCGSSERTVPPAGGTGGSGTDPADAGGSGGTQDAGGSDGGAQRPTEPWRRNSAPGQKPRATSARLWPGIRWR